MRTVALSDGEWKQILGYLRTEHRVYVGNGESCRRFVEGVLWIVRSGAQWRLLPRAYGRWNSVYKRFARWAGQGIWERLLAFVAQAADWEHGMLDSTIVRAHPCAAGAPKKTAVSRH